MHQEVRNIPPAPRRARFRALLAHRWPLLFIGGILIVLGGLIAWAMFLQSSGTFSWGKRLDAGPTQIVDGIVQKVRPTVHFDDQDWDDVHFLATWYQPDLGSEQQAVDLYGYSFAPANVYQVGDPVAVEVLIDSPNIHRVLGGVLRADRRWLYAQFWIGIMVVPGFLILLTWLTAILKLRQVLVHGDVSVGRVLDVRIVKNILPEMLAVTYEFRDHRATVRKNQHWVRARGALGRRLRNWTTKSRKEALPVLHDRRFPQWNRLLLPQDFLLATETFSPEIFTSD